MTLEGHGQGQDEAPPPPATTRWQGELPDDEDILLPPFVPGRSPATPGNREPVAQRGPEAASDTPEPDHPPLTERQPEAAAETVEPEAGPPTESSSYDFPWDAPEEDPFAGTVGAPEMGSEQAGGLDTGPAADEREPVSEVGTDFASDDEFPFEAFDIEGDEGDPGEGARAELAGLSDGPAGELEVNDLAAAPGGQTDQALAERIERLADVLRLEGREGVEREMSSRDRLTALVAGVLAGYMAGLDD